MNKAKKIALENIITTMEVAEILGCSRQYIDKLVKDGKLEVFKQTKRDKLFWKDDIFIYKK